MSALTGLMAAAATATATAAVAAVVVATFGSVQKPSATAAVVENTAHVYAVPLDRVTVTTGIVVGEVTELKVTERFERGAGRVESLAKLTGKLKLTNSSTDQTVRLIGVKILCVDDQGRLITIGDVEIALPLGLTTLNNFPARLDPRQEAMRSLEVELPAAAIGINQLKGIRIDLTYFSVLTGTRSAGR